VEFNSEAALHAVSQGRGRATGCANLTAAETIAAQRCLRNSACSKALGHAGFCDNGKPAAVLSYNPLAGLAAVAEQASNGSAGNHGQTRHKATRRIHSGTGPKSIIWHIAVSKSKFGWRVCMPARCLEGSKMRLQCISNDRNRSSKTAPVAVVLWS